MLILIAQIELNNIILKREHFRSNILIVISLYTVYMHDTYTYKSINVSLMLLAINGDAGITISLIS